MYLVEKVLNNNAILATVIDDQKQVVLIRIGIGFGVKPKDILPQQENAQIYLYQKRDLHGRELSVGPIFFDVASKICEMLKRDFETVYEERIVTLADHIAFAYDRITHNQKMPNPFHEQIKVLNSLEYRYALEAKSIIEQNIPIFLDEDEVGYLTLHISTMLNSTDITKNMEVARVVKLCMDRIDTFLQKPLEATSIEYLRIITHLKWLVIRAENNEKIAIDITDMVQDQFPDAFRIAQEIKMILNKELRLQIRDNEVAYLGIHVQRILDTH